MHLPVCLYPSIVSFLNLLGKRSQKGAIFLFCVCTVTSRMGSWPTLRVSRCYSNNNNNNDLTFFKPGYFYLTKMALSRINISKFPNRKVSEFPSFQIFPFFVWFGIKVHFKSWNSCGIEISCFVQLYSSLSLDLVKKHFFKMTSAFKNCDLYVMVSVFMSRWWYNSLKVQHISHYTIWPN